MGSAACSRPRHAARTCPITGAHGVPVERRTPEALLSDPAGLGEGPFFFCPDPGCDIVYFDASGDEVYRKRNLTVRVGLKEREDPVPLCYCFGHTRASVREEILATGSTTVPDRIKAGVTADECACEVRNPKGSCCLGDVNRAVRDELQRARDGR